MLRDHEFFACLCEKRGLPPIPEISDAIKVSSITGELRLSCLSIMIPVCEIIARTLVSSATIKIIDLSDCMLLSKGLASILDALCEGTTVTALNLKGNNVNGPAVALLGKVLVCNNTLKQLHVEWNSIGTDADSFAAFCDGLARNHNIERLDLRYNQISARCAEHLSRTIRENKSLRNIDLSWNTLGLRGGRLLLNAMRENKTITDLALRGNCIPEDIALAIEQRLRENRSLRTTATEFVLSDNSKITGYPSPSPIKENAVTFAATNGETACAQNLPTNANYAEVNSDRAHLMLETDAEVKRIECEDNEAESAYARANISSENHDDGGGTIADARIADLNRMLQERTEAIDLLTAEIATKNAEMDDTRARLDSLQTRIDRLQKDKETFDSDKATEIAELWKNHDEMEEKLRRDCEEFKGNYNECSRSKEEAESKVQEYEREIRKSSLKIDSLRDKLVSATRAYEDLLSKNKIAMHRLRRESNERDDKHKIELDLLKSTLKETTQALEDCQLELQKSVSESRGLSKNQVLLRTKLDDAERKMIRYAKLEENYRRVEEEKNILEEKLIETQRVVSSLQRQVANLRNELVEPHKRYDSLKEELESEKRKSERLTRELCEESARLKDQNLQMEKMNQQIDILSTRLNEVQSAHTELLHERERERKQLQDIISNKERNLSELRAGEVQRAGQLYAAFSKYLSSIGPTPTS